MNIHKNKMLWYNTRYCIRVSYEKKRLQIRGFQKFQQNGKNYNEFIKISMLKSLEIKGFAGGNRENETWNRRTSKCRKKYVI